MIMGRRKKHKPGRPWHKGTSKQRRFEQELTRISSKEQEFLDLVDMADLLLPYCFKNWRHYFTTEDRFLKEAERWFMAKVEGRPVMIETDRDKGLMNGTRRLDPWDDEDNQFINSHMRDDTLGGKSSQSYYSHWSHSYQSKSWWRQTLPMTPKIPAPSGKSGMTHVCL